MIKNKKNVTVSLSDEAIAALHELMRRRHRNQSNMVEVLIIEAMEKLNAQ